MQIEVTRQVTSMALFVITYEPGVRGCPLVLKGNLNHDWEWDEHDPDPDKFTISHDYEYRSKNPLIDFDFWNSVAIASESFVALCNEFGARTRRVPVRIVQSNKEPTTKRYFYLLWKDWLSILDREESDYELDRDLATGEPISDRYFPSVTRCETITRFVVDEAKVKGKHVFKCIDLDDEVVCDDQFRNACFGKKLLGLKFVPIEEFRKIPFWKQDR